MLCFDLKNRISSMILRDFFTVQWDRRIYTLNGIYDRTYAASRQGTLAATLSLITACSIPSFRERRRMVVYWNPAVATLSGTWLLRWWTSSRSSALVSSVVSSSWDGSRRT